MHFGKQLKLLAYQPWKDHYIDFVGLKHILKDIVKALRAQNRIAINPIRDAFSPPISPPSASSSTPTIPTSPKMSPQRPFAHRQIEEVEEVINGVSLVTIGECESSSTASSTTVKLSNQTKSQQKSATVEGEEEEEEETIVLLTDETLKRFLSELNKEKERVTEFFTGELARAQRELQNLIENAQDRKSKNMSLLPLKKSFFDLLLVCEELLDYSRLNLVGFTKIVKKFTRNTDFEKRAETMQEIQQANFVALLPNVEELEGKVKTKYIDTFKEEGKEANNNKLLQEIVQSVNAARSWKMNTILFQVDEHMRKATIKAQKKKIKPIPVLVALVLLALLYWVPIFPASTQAAQRSLAILVCGTILWVSECWPLYVTSILVSLLVALSNVILDSSGKVMASTDAAKAVFSKLFPSSVALMLAGFSISAAFTKYKIDLIVAHKVLGNKYVKTPQRFLIAAELLCFFMSMWVSNVAASVLTLTVVMPVIRDLPDRCKYISTLLMAIAVAGNCGGMTTQLASPQNTVTVTLGENSIDFIKFIAISLPACPVLLFTGHMLVMKLFPPDITTLPKMDDSQKAAIEAASESSSGAAAKAIEAAHKEIGKKLSKRELFPWKQVAVVAITVISIALWIASNWLVPFGKNIGVISLIPLVLFYGTGLLGKDDFEKLPWAMTMLLAGGNVLGYAVESSKLLNMVSGLLEQLPANTFLLVIVANIIMLIAGSFVSHTVAALILLSLSAKVGSTVGHSKLMVMTSVIMDSGAMPLPVSSFPNLNSISLEDADGQPYLKTTDFLKVGIPQTLFGFICSCTITYGMSLVLGF